MQKGEAREQLCKMQFEVARRLGVRTRCVCGGTHWVGGPDEAPDDEVPGEVLVDMWNQLAASSDRMRLIDEFFGGMILCATCRELTPKKFITTGAGRNECMACMFQKYEEQEESEIEEAESEPDPR